MGSNFAYSEAGVFIPLLLLMRQVGIILGPLWVFWTKHWNFEIESLGLVIDENNSAGLMITILWCFTFVFNLVAISQEPIVADTKKKYSKGEDSLQLEDVLNGEANGDCNANLEQKKLAQENLQTSITADHKYIQVKRPSLPKS